MVEGEGGASARQVPASSVHAVLEAKRDVGWRVGILRGEGEENGAKRAGACRLLDVVRVVRGDTVSRPQERPLDQPGRLGLIRREAAFGEGGRPRIEAESDGASRLRGDIAVNRLQRLSVGVAGVGAKS